MAYPPRPRGNPAHWNSYRPANEPNRDRRPSTRLSDTYSPSPRDTSTYADMADTNPNHLPVRPRHDTYTLDPPARGTPELSRDDGPALWPTALDDLIGQTTRAYDLVINYERDCPSGRRWNADGIARVYKAGKYLHDDVRILRHWKRQVRELGYGDGDMMAKIDEDAERVRVLCEKIKGEIEAEEQGGDGEVYGREQWECEADDSFRAVSRSRSRSRSRGQEDALLDRRGGRRSRSPSPFRPQHRRGRREFDSWRPGSDRPGAAGRLGKYALHY
jgi:hypothetical protein